MNHKIQVEEITCFTLILVNIYQYLSNNLPTFGDNYYVTNNFIHNYLTQYRNNRRTSKCKSTVQSFSTFSTHLTYWAHHCGIVHLITSDSPTIKHNSKINKKSSCSVRVVYLSWSICVCTYTCALEQLLY